MSFIFHFSFSDNLGFFIFVFNKGYYISIFQPFGIEIKSVILFVRLCQSCKFLFPEELKTADSKNEYEIFIEDSQLNPAKSAIIAKKMIEIDRVDAIISIGSNVGNVISPMAQKAKALHFSISSDEPIAKGEYNFLAATPNRKMISKFISELKKHKLNRIALVTQNQAAMLGYDKEFMDVNKDIKVLSHNYINGGEKDYRILIAKILKDNPDAVVPLLYIPEISVFIKQLKDAKPDVTVANLESLSYPEDKTLFNDYWFIDGAVPNRDFVKKFTATAGSDSYDYMPYMYASLQVLKNGFEKFGNDKPEIIDYILENNFDTILGQLNFDDKGIMQTSASVKTIKDGKPIVLEE